MIYKILTKEKADYLASLMARDQKLKQIIDKICDAYRDLARERSELQRKLDLIRAVLNDEEVYTGDEVSKYFLGF